MKQGSKTNHEEKGNLAGIDNFSAFSTLCSLSVC